ncbi:hypothetical protein EVAR_82318_1 [Eumeta japonica]|uniref:ATP-dependent DNA helicase n=1 Tax=Eumeta variegata TaxID=151549 RepID=A0A4C1UB56_EUMVA|nr:hypothetical protein EVAR_82318_1 [Eumeta japonica]
MCDCSLIVWDEGTKSNKTSVQAWDRTMRDLRSKNAPIGGCTILFTDDSRQTLSVVTREILLKVGNGDLTQSNGRINLDNQNLCVLINNIQELVNSVYPDIDNIKCKTISWIKERAILSPIYEQVDKCQLSCWRPPGPGRLRLAVSVSNKHRLRCLNVKVVTLVQLIGVGVASYQRRVHVRGWRLKLSFGFDTSAFGARRALNQFCVGARAGTSAPPAPPAQRPPHQINFKSCQFLVRRRRRFQPLTGTSWTQYLSGNRLIHVLDEFDIELRHQLSFHGFPNLANTLIIRCHLPHDVLPDAAVPCRPVFRIRAFPSGPTELPVGSREIFYFPPILSC